MALRQIFGKVMDRFPTTRLAFAYGSGVFQQKGHKDMSKNILDFIFVVDDPIVWHQQNLVKNAQHYSILKRLGAKGITSIQDNYGSGVYFNTLVPCEGRIIKYGVIGTKRLITDLLEWDTLYVSGRLHKPVLLYQYTDEIGKELTHAINNNLGSAVHTALLLLPETFTELELYMTITGLSYGGDFRMIVGEDKNKVRNIVEPNIEHFRSLYQHILSKHEKLWWRANDGVYEQHITHVSQYEHMDALPLCLIQGMVRHFNKTGKNLDVEEVLRILAQDTHSDDIIKSALRKIVQRSSLTQSIKSIFTAGTMKSIKYSGSKLKKMFKSK
ncbi:unnamed protein product [Owenia fusiformis]|uniref:Phosphatidate cytidylyltransferase, mitochondrial n=1 Tax=Owenia fusiformis TaxID=6347 RepID=A0A8J1U339_OWEFU|nr:unnamed protein product [Owenia fusiformis]